MTPIPLFAAIEGNILFLIIVAVIGVINWLTNRAEEAKKKSQQQPQPREDEGASLNPEEERMRRFLEALGVPTEQRPPPRVQPRPAPKAEQPLPTIRPRGEIAGDWGAPARRREETLRPKAEPARPPQVAPAPEFQRPTVVKPPPLPRRKRPPESRDEEETTHVPAGQLHLPELRTPALPEFETVSSHVSAIPFEAPATAERDAYRQVTASSEQAREPRLAALLRSSGDLRTAIVLREVLGPPRGLQTQDPLPRFP